MRDSFFILFYFLKNVTKQTFFKNISSLCFWSHLPMFFLFRNDMFSHPISIKVSRCDNVFTDMRGGEEKWKFFVNKFMSSVQSVQNCKFMWNHKHSLNNFFLFTHTNSLCELFLNDKRRTAKDEHSWSLNLKFKSKLISQCCRRTIVMSNIY